MRAKRSLTLRRRGADAGFGAASPCGIGRGPLFIVVNETPSEFESVVDRFYADVYRFALSLVRQPAEAADLTQETFLRFAQKRDQIRDPSRTKSWLMTTVFREFNGGRRYASRFPHETLEETELELLPADPQEIGSLDGEAVMRALGELEENFRAPLALFYLEDFSYQEIAAILEIPIGTVMSRLARGKVQIRRLLRDRTCEEGGAHKASRILRLPQSHP